MQLPSREDFLTSGVAEVHVDRTRQDLHDLGRRTSSGGGRALTRFRCSLARRFATKLAVSLGRAAEIAAAAAAARTRYATG